MSRAAPRSECSAPPSRLRLNSAHPKPINVIRSLRQFLARSRNAYSRETRPQSCHCGSHSLISHNWRPRRHPIHEGINNRLDLLIICRGFGASRTYFFRHRHRASKSVFDSGNYIHTLLRRRVHFFAYTSCIQILERQLHGDNHIYPLKINF